jgi:hypothetical protein
VLTRTIVDPVDVEEHFLHRPRVVPGLYIPGTALCLTNEPCSSQAMAYREIALFGQKVTRAYASTKRMGDGIDGVHDFSDQCYRDRGLATILPCHDPIGPE